MFLSIFFEFLIGKGGVGRKRLPGSLQIKGLLKFLIAKVCCVLIRYTSLGERLVGYRKCELSLLRFAVNHAV